MSIQIVRFVISLVVVTFSTYIASAQIKFDANVKKRFDFRARASEIDSRVRSHEEIGFILEKNGKPADFQNASVDTSVKPRGKLMIWLMGHNSKLFDRVNSYGIHAIQVHYANKWFSICCREKPVSETCRGDIRLEAATGMDFSDQVEIPKPDGMMERAFQFVKWLDKKNPEGKWGHFLTKEKRWTAVGRRDRRRGFARFHNRFTFCEIQKGLACCRFLRAA